MKYLTLFIFLFYHLSSFGQTTLPDNLQEKIKIFTDNQTYVSGEKIWFSLYVLDQNNNLFPGSKIAYMELIAPSGKSVLQQTMAVDSGRSSGALYLPLDLESGNYQLHVYTSFMRNFSNSSAWSNICILNPFIALKRENVVYAPDSGSNIPGFPEIEAENRIIIKADKQIYTKTDKVILELSAKEEIVAGLTIGVRKIDSLDRYAPLEKNQNTGSTRKKDLTYMPEFEGAVVKLQTNPKQSGLKAYLSMPGPDYIFKGTESNNEGVFNFVLPQRAKGGEIMIYMQEEAQYVQLQYLTPYRKDLSNTLPALQFHATDTVFLKQRSLAMQVQNVFNVIKTSEDRDSSALPFYGKADKVYNLDEYTRFPTMAEVLVEFIPEVQLKKTGGESLIRIYEKPLGKFFYSRPLLLLDGRPLPDSDEFLKINPLQIEKLEIINSKFLWGDSYFEGILSATSYEDKYNSEADENAALSFYYSGIMEMQEFTAPTYNDSTPANFADYRNLLYWNPNLPFSKGAKTDIYTGDIPGIYEIQVWGLTAGGEWISGRQTFEVR